jgi:hypothetical protein
VPIPGVAELAKSVVGADGVAVTLAVDEVPPMAGSPPPATWVSDAAVAFAAGSAEVSDVEQLTERRHRDASNKVDRNEIFKVPPTSLHYVSGGLAEM